MQGRHGGGWTQPKNQPPRGVKTTLCWTGVEEDVGEQIFLVFTAQWSQCTEQNSPQLLCPYPSKGWKPPPNSQEVFEKLLRPERCTLEFFNLREEKSANGIEFAQQDQPLKQVKNIPRWVGNRKAQKDVGRFIFFSAEFIELSYTFCYPFSNPRTFAPPYLA